MLHANFAEDYSLKGGEKYAVRSERKRVEYALILVLVAIVVIAVLMLLGPIIANVFSTLNSSLSSASS